MSLELTTDVRIELMTESVCEIWSRSQQSWCKAYVKDIYIDDSDRKEWLIVCYADNKKKKIQRFCNHLRVCAFAINSRQSRDSRLFGNVVLQSSDSRETPARARRRSSRSMRSRSRSRSHSHSETKVMKKEEKQLYNQQRVKIQHKDCSEQWLEDEQRQVFARSTPFTKRAIVTETEYGWHKLQKAELQRMTTIYSNMVRVSDYEFIMGTEISVHLLGDTGGLYKYNAIQNEWSLLMSYPKNATPISAPLEMVYDDVRRQVYIFGVTRTGIGSSIIKFDIESCATEVRTFVGRVKMELIDDDCHILSSNGRDETQHYMVDRRRFGWNQMSLYLTLSGDKLPYAMVYVHAQQKLFGFGTVDINDRYWDHSIWCCPIGGAQKWKKYKQLRLPFGGRETSFAFAKSLDERYVVFFANTIYVLHLYEMRFYANYRIQPPLSALDYNAVTMPYCTENEAKVVTFSYIKESIYEHQKMRQIVPMELIALICKYWMKEFVYLMDKKATAPKLWGICLDEILDGLVPI